MKKITFFFVLLFCFKSFSQTKYYTVNGKEIMSKRELDSKVLQIKGLASQSLKEEAFVTFEKEKSISRNDSIIVFGSFEVKNSKALNNYLGRYLNKKIPDYLLTTIEGEEISLSNYHGKPTLINFWFTRCPPCIEEMPVLNELKREHGNEFNFISITYENKESVESFLKKHEFNFDHIISADKLIEDLDVKAYPLNLFIDKNGVIKYAKDGIPMIYKDGKSEIGDGQKFLELLNSLK